jgi:nitrate/TMAO reductase-like tetraheme cytochrome c subunit
MSFRAVFLAVVIAFALVLSAFLINRARPRVEVEQASAAGVRATGKCAECHLRNTYSIVHEYELSVHAKKGVTCLDCHQPAAGQEKKDHHGFVISTQLTAGNCRSCHEGIYQQFLRSRHAAPAWAAVFGEKGLTPEEVNFSEKYQPGGTRRPPHPFVQLEGASAMTSGCSQCGINGVGVTHDPSERLSYYLASAISEKRPNYAQAQAKMKQVCTQCHTPALIDRVYQQAELAVQNTNQRVQQAQELMTSLRKEGALSGPPFSQPIDFVYFDLWHYDGRTSKHGAFMGGADFVQWHGNYPMLQRMVQMKAMAADLRRQHGGPK